MQWVHLGAAEILVASGEKAWIQQREPGVIGLDGPMPESLAASRESTRNLLDGAIAAAERAHPPAPPAPMTATRWASELVNQWYISVHTIDLLAQAAERFAEMGRAELARFTRLKFEEERGDEEFPLRDLAALGYDAHAVVAEVPPSAAAVRLIDYARGCVNSDHPVDFLGYGHAIERHAIRVTPAYIAAVERALPPDVDAVSGLREHAADLDVRHVEEAIAFFTRLPAADRTRIALSCYRASVIRAGSNSAEDPTEAELERRLQPLRTHTIHP